MRTLRYNGDYRLAFAYDDGLSAELDFNPYVAGRHGPMLEPIREERGFAQAFLDFRVLTWPHGYDICPDVLRAWCEAGRILSREETGARLASAPNAPINVG